MAVNESPLETRESLVALLSNRYFSNNSLGNIGKQFDDAMKFLEEVCFISISHELNIWRYGCIIHPGAIASAGQVMEGVRAERLGHFALARRLLAPETQQVSES